MAVNSNANVETLRVFDTVGVNTIQGGFNGSNSMLSNKSDHQLNIPPMATSIEAYNDSIEINI